MAATFRISPEKKGVQLGGIRIPTGFRRPRKRKRVRDEPFIFVEKRRQRLSTPTEVRAIQRARRRKKRK